MRSDLPMPVPLLIQETTCSRTASAELALYLTNTPVGSLAAAINSGDIAVSRATVGSRAHFGGISTIFGNLDGLYAENLTGRQKFLVNEVRHVLARKDCRASDDKAKLDRLMTAMRSRTLTDWRITLLVNGGEHTLMDGNKRAVAFYEVTDPAARFELTLMVLRPRPRV